MRALVTGSEGSIGAPLCRELENAGWDVCPFDLVFGDDITEPFAITPTPDVVFHLAAAKHAPEGELDPWEATRINVLGTQNVLELGVRTILASTCKAADPETVYGATKLIAERMVLAAGGSVARFYNVREAAGNVFETWATIPADEPLPVTACRRYFIGRKQAVELLIALLDADPGRYTVDPGPAQWISSVAREHYPGRLLRMIPARRGDRLAEPRIATCETLKPAGAGGLQRIRSPHDPAYETHRATQLV